MGLRAHFVYEIYKGINMKNALLTAIFAGLASLSLNVSAEPETKKVCIEQKDAKTGKTKEVCKTVKVHKKLEGTKVPEPAKK
jgi:hypothetical protein